MPVSFTTFVDGDVMVADDVRTEIQKGYAFIGGGIVNADVTKTAFDTENIYRPDFYPYPLRGINGCKQGIAGGGYSPDALDHNFKTDRFDIFPRPPPAAFYAGSGSGAALDIDEKVPIPGLQRTIRTGKSAGYVVFRAHWSVMLASNAVANPAYAGHFIVSWRERSTPGTRTEIRYTRRNLYVPSTPFTGSIGGRKGQICMSAVAVMNVGLNDWLDFWVEYDRGSCDADVYQLMIGYRESQIAYHMTG